MYDMLKNMDPPLGFGNKCPNRLAYKKLIRMNMPVDDDGKVNFTTTLFALIRENLSIKVRSGKFIFITKCLKMLFNMITCDSTFGMYILNIMEGLEEWRHYWHVSWSYMTKHNWYNRSYCHQEAEKYGASKLQEQMFASWWKFCFKYWNTGYPILYLNFICSHQYCYYSNVLNFYQKYRVGAEFPIKYTLLGNCFCTVFAQPARKEHM